MIMSVSTLIIGSGAATAVSVVNFSMGYGLLGAAARSRERVKQAAAARKH
jgi:hypothetical protein